ncbi:Zinc finger CCCH domain-containing protein 30 [Senna tora]|uniref:Zinc finger CCCH domain-containing protein 30 n=1 Tax=Senna tora TaxID=362788 RepID=A0A834SXE4_9FABA|nr:Zinc finger CCCH domain-containing protein 30 [Senna tora]
MHEKLGIWLPSANELQLQLPGLAIMTKIDGISSTTENISLSKHFTPLTGQSQRHLKPLTLNLFSLSFNFPSVCIWISGVGVDNETEGIAGLDVEINGIAGVIPEADNKPTGSPGVDNGAGVGGFLNLEAGVPNTVLEDTLPVVAAVLCSLTNCSITTRAAAAAKSTSDPGDATEEEVLLSDCTVARASVASAANSGLSSIGSSSRGMIGVRLSSKSSSSTSKEMKGLTPNGSKEETACIQNQEVNHYPQKYMGATLMMSLLEDDLEVSGQLLKGNPQIGTISPIT